MKNRLVLVLAAAGLLLPGRSWLQAQAPSDQDPRRTDTEVSELSPRPVTEEPNRLLLALSDQDYPVTPGDAYEISYVRPEGDRVMLLTVQSDYRVDLQVFGSIDATGLAFPELKSMVERRVATSFPRSSPAVTMRSVGGFQVLVRGAVRETRTVAAWGLTRLSEALEGLLMPFSSIRDVEVLSRDGTTKTYDLLSALNQGTQDQNPRVKPGDTITVNRRLRKVELSGEVYNPGKFDVLADDDMEKLITGYGQGLTPFSDPSRIRVSRAASGGLESFLVDLYGSAEGFRFVDGDVVTVPSKTDRLAVVYVEGGIRTAAPGAGEPEPTTLDYRRLRVQFIPGETLYDLMNGFRERISSFALLDQAQLLRAGAAEPIAVDLQDLLFRYDVGKDYELEPFDRIVIPVGSPYVAVTGAVQRPGRYPFVTGRSDSYYIELAGGVDSRLSAAGRVTVVDSDGQAKRRDTVVEPGDTINVHADSFVYVEGGIIGNGGLGETVEGIEDYDRIRIPLLQGQTLYELLVGVRERISPFALLDQATLVRATADSAVPVDLDRLLFDYAPEADVRLEPHDRIVIPVQRPVVTVFGAANNPGSIPFMAGRPYSYYLNLAGGVDLERNVGNRVTVYTADGQAKDRDAAIEPGDAIRVHTNSFVYNFSRYFPIVTSGLTFVSAVISLITLLSQ